MKENRTRPVQDRSSLNFTILEVSVQCLGLFWRCCYLPAVRGWGRCLKVGHYICVLLQINKTLNKMKAQSCVLRCKPKSTLSIVPIRRRRKIVWCKIGIMLKNKVQTSLNISKRAMYANKWSL